VLRSIEALYVLTSPGIPAPEGHVGEFITKQPLSTSANHQRYLDGKLIRFLEDDIDLEKRTTRKQIDDMSNAELTRYLAKITSKHKLWWEAEQRNYKHGESDIKTVLADFNQQEQRQSRQINGATTNLFGARYIVREDTFGRIKADNM
jgi:hypothetical protein